MPAPYGTLCQLQLITAHLRETSVLHCLMPSDRAVIPSVEYVKPGHTPQSWLPFKLQQRAPEISMCDIVFTGAHIHMPFGACRVYTLPTKKPFR